MDNLKDIIFKSKFWKITAQSVIITILFFVTIDNFMKIMAKNIGLVLLSLITFYLIFTIYIQHEVNIK